ncbi:MAG: Gfo/Idh/MocA family oxidoreductase, partial [Candidatus Aerophobetes bacterium]|nr:Gfo/Idh/MocA family oxidoreductase [Candidatus Aerophobetes bacterium]
MVKVAILGAGFMGSMHAECYNNLSNAKLSAIADTDLARAEKLAKKYGVKAYSKPEELFKEKDIEIMDICLPTFLHKEYVIKAAQARKNILCEKPIALKVEDAEEMIEAANKVGVKFMVAQVIRFWPEYIKLKEIFDKGSLGEIVSISCTRLSPTPTWAWNSWLLDSEKSGGALLDLHIHDTDFLLYLLGKPISLLSLVPKSSLKYAHVFTPFLFPNNVVAYA